MRIDVSELRREMGRSEQHILSGAVALVEGPPVEVDLNVRLTNVGSALIGDFTAEFEIRTLCSRCLEETVVPIRIEFQREFRAGQPDSDGDDVSWYQGDVVDVEPDVREQVVLAIPMQPLCSEDCRGLCPICGQDLNRDRCSCAEPVDPRLEALTRFLSPEKDGGQ